MSPPTAELKQLLATLRPELHDGVYCFASIPAGEAVTASIRPVARFHEREGETVIVGEADARAAGLRVLFRAAWITLGVRSELEAVGFTAAFASALAESGIPANVVAGALHDHVFVPADRGRDALNCLMRLQREAKDVRPAAR